MRNTSDNDNIIGIKLLRELEQIMQLGGFVYSAWGFFQSDGNFNFKGGINI
jgi:hypothetical protein